MQLLIDGNNLAFRVYHAHKYLSADGVPIGMVYGGLQSARRLRQMFPKATRMVCCWDSRSSIRKKINPSYKADRKKTPERKQVFDQMPILREALATLGIQNVEHDGFEADDVMAVLAEGLKTVMVSTDTDLYQLLAKGTTMFKPTTETFYGLPEFTEEFGVSPSSWATVLAISGGKNNVKGVPGVGIKTVINFLGYGKIQEKLSDSIVEFVDSGKAKSNLKLTKLPVEDFVPKVQRAKPDAAAFRSICVKYKFNSILKEFNAWKALFFNH